MHFALDASHHHRDKGCMDTNDILAAVATEKANGLNISEAEVLRYAVWRVWTDRAEALGLDDAAAPTTMTSSEWADAVASLGIGRGSAMNRHSDARRNWEAMHG